MYDTEKLDSVVVPMKLTNKGGKLLAESVEGRTLAKGNIHQAPADRTQSRGSASSGLADVRKAARKHKEMKFTALLHHVSPRSPYEMQ